MQLQTRYGTANRIKIFELKRELAYTSQGTLVIASYFNKLKMLWDELGVMCTNHEQRCTCVAKLGILQVDEDNRLFQFLMGLNETYMGVRSNLLMMQPLPSLDSAYNILLNDEKQRQVQSNSLFNPNSMSFNVSTQIKPGFGFGFNLSATSNLPPPRPYAPRINFDQNRAPCSVNIVRNLDIWLTSVINSMGIHIIPSLTRVKRLQLMYLLHHLLTLKAVFLNLLAL